MRKFWITMLYLVCAIAATGAQGQASVRLTPQLALSRICVSEAGFPDRDVEDRDGDGDLNEWIFTDDCAAIYEVLRFRAEQRRMTFVTMARLYSNLVFDETSARRRAWVGDLMPDGSRPRRWPEATYVRQADGSSRRVPHAAWSNYRSAWLATYEYAGRVARGEVVANCEMYPVAHWGSPTLDRHRAVSAGWIEVDCGATRNDFWAVPALLESANDEVDVD